SRGLHEPRYGQCCEHDRQVRLNRIPGPVKDRPGSQVGLRHPKGLLDLPQVVIAADDLGRWHSPDGNVRHVAFEPRQLHRPLIRLLIEGFHLVRDFHEPGALRRLVPIDDCQCAVALQLQRLLITHHPLGDFTTVDATRGLSAISKSSVACPGSRSLALPASTRAARSSGVWAGPRCSTIRYFPPVLSAICTAVAPDAVGPLRTNGLIPP